MVDVGSNDTSLCLIRNENNKKFKNTHIIQELCLRLQKLTTQLNYC